MTTRERILCIDDDQDQCDLLETALARLGYVAVSTTSPTAGLEALAKGTFDAVITDIGMGEMEGITLCQRVIDTHPNVPVLVLTGQGTMEAAVGALRAGAYDFLHKPVDSNLLGISLARALQHAKLRAEVQRLKTVLHDRAKGRPLIGNSPAMKRLVELIGRIAGSDASVLIQGETGTGKELVARAVHGASARRDGPFIAINCAAMPASLLESELFGHARGAFTDANTARQGLFVEASGGTLFLDEVGDMPPEMQVKLLRAIQERRVRPVGGNSEIEFDARIIAATHRDLEAEVEAKRFREDLYYRINVVRIDVPALRERNSDVLELTAHFLEAAGSRSGKGRLELTPIVAGRLLSYDWPGNVRELENCIERAVALARFDQLTVEDLPEKVRGYRGDNVLMAAGEGDEIVTIAEVERRYMLHVLQLVNGNKAKAAQLLQVDRRTLYRKLERYEASPMGAESREEVEYVSPAHG
jgi:DNA-binding NtrC family response regulator